MKIELKNIHHSERLSEETNAFTANLYIDGFKAGVASNQGHGGPTDYYGLNGKGNELIKEAEAYCKTLPPEKFTAGGKEYTLDSNLEGYIDRLLENHLQQKEIQKFNNKLNKAMGNGIVYGVPDQSFTALPFNLPISKVLDHPSGPEVIRKKIVERVIPHLEKEEKILNTNIPESLLKEAGLTADQYVQQEAASKRVKKQIKKPGRKI